MSTHPARSVAAVFAFGLLASLLSGCAADGGYGYDYGYGGYGYYEPGFAYGSWGPGYHVGPFHRDDFHHGGWRGPSIPYGRHGDFHGGVHGGGFHEGGFHGGGFHGGGGHGGGFHGSGGHGGGGHGR